MEMSTVVSDRQVREKKEGKERERERDSSFLR